MAQHTTFYQFTHKNGIMKEKITEAAEGIIAYKNGGTTDDVLQKIIESAIANICKDLLSNVSYDISSKRSELF